MPDIKIYLQEKKKVVDDALTGYMSSLEGNPPTIQKAMEYSLFAGGKRLRPILTLASFEAVDGDPGRVLPFACAIELIHTYSLIHDDLPAMDDDDYRRGVLTNHKVHGEAAAILAGDALLTEAFRIMTDSRVVSSMDPAVVLDVIHDISGAAGAPGMVGGQMADVEAEGKEVDISHVEYIHTHKTGALITASVRAGGKLGGGSEEAIESLSSYGRTIGLAFQIIDDVLNVEGEEEVLGKSVGSDAGRGKATYPGVLGINKSKETADAFINTAISSLKRFGDKAEPLKKIARYIGDRKK